MTHQPKPSVTHAPRARAAAPRFERSGRPAVALRMLLVALVAPLGASCDALTDNGNEDIAGLIGSQFVPITVTGASISNGVITGETALRPESFLTNLRAKLGHTPTRVDLLRISVERPIESTGAGVDAWAELFTDKVELFIVPEGSDLPILVGEGSRPATGVAAWAPEVAIPRGGLDRFPAVAEGRFAVRLSGVTSKAASDSFSFPIRIELELMAF